MKLVCIQNIELLSFCCNGDFQVQEFICDKQNTFLAWQVMESRLLCLLWFNNATTTHLSWKFHGLFHCALWELYYVDRNFTSEFVFTRLSSLFFVCSVFTLLLLYFIFLIVWMYVCGGRVVPMNASVCRIHESAKFPGVGIAGY